MRQSDLFKQPKRPWNAGRLIGPKAPLKPKHIWAIRQQLKVAKRIRDLAMFNSALDAKLRACDLVRLVGPFIGLIAAVLTFAFAHHSAFNAASREQ